MHCINTDYPAFCFCEEVATPTSYFMGGTKNKFIYFWHSKKYISVPNKISVQSTRKTSQVTFCFLRLDPVLIAPEN